MQGAAAQREAFPYNLLFSLQPEQNRLQNWQVRSSRDMRKNGGAALSVCCPHKG